MLMGHDVLAVNGNCFFFFFHKLLVPDTMANLFMSVSLVRKGEHIVKNTTTLPLCCSLPFPSEFNTKSSPLKLALIVSSSVYGWRSAISFLWVSFTQSLVRSSTYGSTSRLSMVVIGTATLVHVGHQTWWLHQQTLWQLVSSLVSLFMLFLHLVLYFLKLKSWLLVSCSHALH